MTDKPSSSRKRLRRFTFVLAGLAAFGVLVAAGGFAFAASKESHDPFCASCHTQPESTFFQRSTAAQPVDLASYHTTQQTRCIDCHSGPGILGRLRAEWMGAHNALAWYTHTAVQPAVLTHPIRDANCLKCHQDVTQRGYVPKVPIAIGGLGEGEGREGEEGGSNHWHEFLARWQTVDLNAGTCTSCHPGHSTGGTAQTGFENLQTTRAVCEDCHGVLRGEREG
jgi:nitrate/TMAO reductase-like tetraheme cytochrome c subunit